MKNIWIMYNSQFKAENCLTYFDELKGYSTPKFKFSH